MELFSKKRANKIELAKQLFASQYGFLSVLRWGLDVSQDDKKKDFKNLTDQFSINQLFFLLTMEDRCRLIDEIIRETQSYEKKKIFQNLKNHIQLVCKEPEFRNLQPHIPQIISQQQHQALTKLHQLNLSPTFFRNKPLEQTQRFQSHRQKALETDEDDISKLLPNKQLTKLFPVQKKQKQLVVDSKGQIKQIRSQDIRQQDKRQFIDQVWKKILKQQQKKKSKTF